MISLRTVLGFTTASLLAAGLAMAQQSTPAPAPGGPGGPGGMHGRGMAMMATALDLTDTQTQQARTIFDGARNDAKPLRDQLQQQRDAIRNAIKANDTAQIQSLSQKQGELMGQMMAIHMKATAQFWAILAPEQQAKAEKMLDQMGGPFGPGMGGMGRGPMGHGPMGHGPGAMK